MKNDKYNAHVDVDVCVLVTKKEKDIIQCPFICLTLKRKNCYKCSLFLYKSTMNNQVKKFYKKEIFYILGILVMVDKCNQLCNTPNRTKNKNEWWTMSSDWTANNITYVFFLFSLFLLFLLGLLSVFSISFSPSQTNRSFGQGKKLISENKVEKKWRRKMKTQTTNTRWCWWWNSLFSKRKEMLNTRCWWLWLLYGL